MVTYYSDEAAIILELKKYYSDGSSALSDEDIIRIRVKADQKVNAKLINIKIPIPTPAPVVEAASLFAISRGLDIIFAEQDTRSPLAVQNDKDAYEILTGYILENPDEASATQLGCFVVDGNLLTDEDEEA
jgi:hypothetical protein